jgi:hypothetical protein
VPALLYSRDRRFPNPLLAISGAILAGKSLSCGAPQETSFSCYLSNLIEVRYFDCSQLIAGGFSMGAPYWWFETRRSGTAL